MCYLSPFSHTSFKICLKTPFLHKAYSTLRVQWFGLTELEFKHIVKTKFIWQSFPSFSSPSVFLLRCYLLNKVSLTTVFRIVSCPVPLSLVLQFFLPLLSPCTFVTRYCFIPATYLLSYCPSVSPLRMWAVQAKIFVLFTDTSPRA